MRRKDRFIMLRENSVAYAALFCFWTSGKTLRFVGKYGLPVTNSGSRSTNFGLFPPRGERLWYHPPEKRAMLPIRCRGRRCSDD